MVREKFCTRKHCKDKLDCLSEINFQAANFNFKNLLSRMSYLSFYAWINFRRWKNSSNFKWIKFGVLSYLGFLSREGKGEAIYLIPLHHFHLLHRHLHISQAITVESSPLYIASSRTWAGNLFFPSANP